MVQFLEKLIAGDLRAIITLIMLVLIFYTLSKRFREIPPAYLGALRTITTVAIIVLIYGFFTKPEVVASIFNGAVDFVVNTIERISSVSDDSDAFID